VQPAIGHRADIEPHAGLTGQGVENPPQQLDIAPRPPNAGRSFITQFQVEESRSQGIADLMQQAGAHSPEFGEALQFLQVFGSDHAYASLLSVLAYLIDLPGF